jgi:hypothetical protein
MFELGTLCMARPLQRLLGDKRLIRTVFISNSYNVDSVFESAFFGFALVQLSKNLELTAAKNHDLTVLQRPIERLGECRVFAINLTPDSGKATFAWIQRATAGSFETERRNDS